MQKLNDLVFPIVTFSYNDHLYFLRNLDELCSCTKRGFDNGFYNNLIIVDSNGYEYKVKDASLSKSSLIDKLNYWVSFRKLKAELTLDSDVRLLDLEEIQSRLIKSMQTHIDLWDTGNSLNRVIKEIKTSSSPKSLISKLTANFYKKV